MQALLIIDQTRSGCEQDKHKKRPPSAGQMLGIRIMRCVTVLFGADGRIAVEDHAPCGFCYSRSAFRVFRQETHSPAQPPEGGSPSVEAHPSNNWFHPAGGAWAPHAAPRARCCGNFRNRGRVFFLKSGRVALAATMRSGGRGYHAVTHVRIAMGGRVSISQKTPSTAAKAGKPNANQVQNRR